MSKSRAEIAAIQQRLLDPTWQNLELKGYHRSNWNKSVRDFHRLLRNDTGQVVGVERLEKVRT